MIPLGSKVKDTISGFTGIAVARSEWLTGCIRYGVESEGLKDDGSIMDTYWIDESRLKIVKAPAKGLVVIDPQQPAGGTSNPRLSNGG